MANIDQFLANRTYEEILIFNTARVFAGSLVQIFRDYWERIHFSFDLDRSPIFEAGQEFSCLVEGLVAAGFLQGVSSALSGVYIQDFVAQCRSRDEKPSLNFVGGVNVFTIGNVYVLDGAPVYLEKALHEIVQQLVALVDTITLFSQELQGRIGEMENFDEEPHSILSLGRQFNYRALTVITGRHFYCLQQVTHLRLKVATRTIGNGANKSVSLEFCAAWGETTHMWEHMGWNVDHWLPHPQQQAAGFEGCRANHFGVYWFNLNGALNPALERRLLRIKAGRAPAMFVFTRVEAPPSHVYRVMAILGFEGHRVNASVGGTWLVWDTSRIFVRFLRNRENGWELVMTRQRP